MLKYTEASIRELFSESKGEAIRLLSTLEILDGRAAKVHIGGWIFEQIIRKCLTDELAALGLCPAIAEQVQLKGRSKVDFLFGNVAIELKLVGSFGKCDSKYAEHRKIAEEKGWNYLYLTLGEKVVHYKATTIECFGYHKAFFLDHAGEWERFVNNVRATLASTKTPIIGL